MHFVVKRQEQLLALFILKGIMFFLGWFGVIRNQPTRGEKILCKCWETPENCTGVQQEEMSQRDRSKTQHLHLTGQKHLFEYL